MAARKRTREPTATDARQVVLARLRALRIAATTFTRPVDAVAWLGAVQAQDYLGALWAVGLRLAGATELDVERALADGGIVRTWPMRGTLHFVAAADARWLTELLAPRAVAAGASRLREFGIDSGVLKRARAVLAKQLAGGRHLSRPELYRVLEDARIATANQRGIHLLWRLAQECFLCFGPRVGKQPSFVLFDDWLPRARRLRGDEALAALAVRYFTSHGPATVRDLAWWSGLTLGEARRSVLAAGRELSRTTLGGDEYLSAAATEPFGRARRVNVLPAFDELLVGYRYGGTFVNAAVTKRVRSGGMIHAVVVVDGRVSGTWGRRLTPHEVKCTLAPFEPLNAAATRGAERACERYARFLGRRLRLEVSEPRPHK
jgi:hypothetical protein